MTDARSARWPVRLADRFRAGATVYSGWCGLGLAPVADAYARAGFEAVALDMQHGLYDVARAFDTVASVTAAGAAAIVRTPVGEPQTASRMIDAGAQMVIAPMVNTPAEARAFAGFVKYPPLGERSWGAHAALRLAGLSPSDYIAQANTFTFAFVMVETRAALDAVDAICAVEGMDGVFVGPADLSIGLTGRLDPEGRETDAALDRIAAACARHGKIAGAFAATPARARALSGRGYRFLAVGFDGDLVRDGAAALAAGLKD